MSFNKTPIETKCLIKRGKCKMLRPKRGNCYVNIVFNTFPEPTINKIWEDTARVHALWALFTAWAFEFKLIRSYFPHIELSFKKNRILRIFMVGIGAFRVFMRTRLNNDQGRFYFHWAFVEKSNTIARIKLSMLLLCWNTESMLTYCF